MSYQGESWKWACLPSSSKTNQAYYCTNKQWFRLHMTTQTVYLTYAIHIAYFIIACMWELIMHITHIACMWERYIVYIHPRIQGPFLYQRCEALVVQWRIKSPCDNIFRLLVISAYTGASCQEPEYFCDDSTCQNGGTCTLIPGRGSKCECPYGKTGFYPVLFIIICCLVYYTKMKEK